VGDHLSALAAKVLAKEADDAGLYRRSLEAAPDLGANCFNGAGQGTDREVSGTIPRKGACGW
jgi:hypothetical protein